MSRKPLKMAGASESSYYSADSLLTLSTKKNVTSELAGRELWEKLKLSRAGAKKQVD